MSTLTLSKLKINSKKMKKSVYITVLSLMVILLLSNACTSDKRDESVNLLEFDTFKAIGQLHNNFMSNVENNFIPDESLTSLDEKIDYIAAFQVRYINNCTLLQSDREIFVENMIKSKDLANIDILNKLVAKDIKGCNLDELQSVYSLIEETREYQLIDDFEYFSLLQMADMARLCLAGSVSQDELWIFLNNMKKKWIMMKYPSDSNVGYLSGYVIAVALSSIDWWELNPESGALMTKSINIIPAWVAADAVGALWGATSAAIGSYIVNGGVRWGSVGYGALSGAVAGSTGVVGKVAKWISRLF
jgi:hypothetical protein